MRSRCSLISRARPGDRAATRIAKRLGPRRASWSSVVELGREQPRRPAELLVGLAASDGLADEQAERLLRADTPVDRLLEPLAPQRGGDHLAPRQVEQVVEHVERLREHPPPLHGEVADGGPGEDVADQPDRRVGRVERGPVRRAVEEQPGLVQADRSDPGEPADPRPGGERREHDRDVEALSRARAPAFRRRGSGRRWPRSRPPTRTGASAAAKRRGRASPDHFGSSLDSVQIGLRWYPGHRLDRPCCYRAEHGRHWVVP